MNILVTEGLSKHYGRRVGVEDLNLSLEEGGVCGFLGPNGAGKSTTIRLLLGFLKPSRGSACLFGLDCWREAERIKQDVGYLPGDLRLYPWLTPRSALGLVSRIRRRDCLRAGLPLAAEFELELDVRVGEMSRGTRQKLGLILALAHAPRLLILDEPTSSLDPVMQEKLKERLLAMAARGHTVLFSSHSLAEVERLCQRVVILRAGRVAADAPLAELRERARREVVIRWREGAGAAPAEPPPDLEDLERQGLWWRGRLKGSAAELVRWLAGKPLADLTVGPPDMERIFQSYYRQEAREPEIDELAADQLGSDREGSP